jgi:hypothetical protein
MFSLLHWQAGLIAGISLPGRGVAVCQLADTTAGPTSTATTGVPGHMRWRRRDAATGRSAEKLLNLMLLE